MLETAWALNNPESRADWGWRAMHGSVVLGKALVSSYYGRPIKYSYYSGCSTGGRQGLREIQQFPTSFDGALIGAPAWWATHLNNYITKAGTYNLPVADPKHIPMALVPFIKREVTRQCDSQDGVVDGIVSDPIQCEFDFGKLLCPAVKEDVTIADQNTTCLMPEQVDTAKRIYADYISSETGRTVYPGLTLSSEPQWPLLFGHTNPPSEYSANHPSRPSFHSPSPFGTGYASDFLLNNPNWDWRSYNDSLVSLADRLNPGRANADNFAALKAYKSRGGKLLLYHGLADGLVPVKGSLLYYNKTVSAFDGSLDSVRDFFRLFLVPGMQHCWNTDDAVKAPWNFGGATQAGAMGMGEWSVPGYRDARHDAMMAMMDWVEQGKAVDEVVATSWNGLWSVKSGVKRQRPLCAWPEKPVWDGKGDVDAARGWRCTKGGR